MKRAKVLFLMLGLSKVTAQLTLEDSVCCMGVS